MLFEHAYTPIKHSFIKSEILNEVKFQLATGLQKSRKHSKAKELFHELSADGFEMEKTENLWDDATISSIFERNWIAIGIVGNILRTIPLASAFCLLHFSELSVLSVAVITFLTHELMEYFHFEFKFKQYLKGFTSSLAKKIRSKLTKFVLIELFFSILFYFGYYTFSAIDSYAILYLFGSLVVFRLFIDFKLLPDELKRLNQRKGDTAN